MVLVSSITECNEYFYSTVAHSIICQSILDSLCAGYYSYLYAKCFASTIWRDVCFEDPLSPAVGSHMRTRFLQHGGAKDPCDLLKDLAGDGIIRYSGGGIIPDVRSLCKEMCLWYEGLACLLGISGAFAFRVTLEDRFVVACTSSHTTKEMGFPCQMLDFQIIALIKSRCSQMGILVTKFSWNP